MFGALSLWPFLPFASRAPIYGQLLVALMRDPRVPWSNKLLLGIGAAYVISPVDLIPDFIPIISRIDDLAILVIAIDLFLDTVPREVLIEKLYALNIDGRELERDLEWARRVIPGPLRLAVRRLPGAMEQGAASIRARIARQQALRRSARQLPAGSPTNEKTDPQEEFPA